MYVSSTSVVSGVDSCSHELSAQNSRVAEASSGRCYHDRQLTQTERARFDVIQESVDTSAGMDGALLADLENKFSFAGPFVPCLVPHGKVVSISKRVFLTGKELMAAMGGGSDADSPAMMRPGDAADDDAAAAAAAAAEDDNDSLPDESAFDRR